MFTLICIYIAAVFNSICHCENYELPEKVYYDLNLSESHFQDFVLKYNKQYTPADRNRRFQIFQENLKIINALNEKHEFTVFEVNRFADLTYDEFKKSRSCLFNVSDVKPMTISKFEYPDELDYRKQNLVSEVKDQGGCGACYIFAAIGDIEGQYAKKTKKVVSLSEQYPMDCSGKLDCEGGWPSWVINWLATTPGPLTTADSPYLGIEGNCTVDPNKGVVRVKPTNDTSVSSTIELRTLLASHGPLAIALCCPMELTYYRAGVLIPDECDIGLDHAVTLVGYGVDRSIRYWLIKNSWGADWGDSGYFRIAFNACGVGTYLSPSELV